VPGSEGSLPADLVLFAMGFSGPVESDVVRELDLPVVPRGRFKGLDANERDYRVKARPKVFAAGDIRRGQSLVVWAIREGRQAAHAIDRLLMGRSDLPR
jgi:glutamate synthase (NADPH) small chain